MCLEFWSDPSSTNATTKTFSEHASVVSHQYVWDVGSVNQEVTCQTPVMKLILEGRFQRAVRTDHHCIPRTTLSVEYHEEHDENFRRKWTSWRTIVTFEKWQTWDDMDKHAASQTQNRQAWYVMFKEISTEHSWDQRWKSLWLQRWDIQEQNDAEKHTLRAKWMISDIKYRECHGSSILELVNQLLDCLAARSHLCQRIRRAQEENPVASIDLPDIKQEAATNTCSAERADDWRKVTPPFEDICSSSRHWDSIVWNGEANTRSGPWERDDYRSEWTETSPDYWRTGSSRLGWLLSLVTGQSWSDGWRAWRWWRWR